MADVGQPIDVAEVTVTDADLVSTVNTSEDSFEFGKLDANVLVDLEKQAMIMGQNLNRILTELKGTMHGMSNLTAECAELYDESICKTCDSVDNSIKTVYQLMAKTEELSHSLKPIPKLAQQIKEIRRLVELYDGQIHK